MTIKTITVTEDAYNAIKKMKLGDESFSDLFLRIGEGNLKIKDLIGALKLPPDAHANLKSSVLANRKAAQESHERRMCLAHFGH